MTNDGTFDIRTSKIGSWGLDDFYCVKNADIDWVEDFGRNAAKRSCTVAVIDGEFDTSHIAFKNAKLIDGITRNTNENSEHGTAVLSVLCGTDQRINSPLSKTDINILLITAIDETKGDKFDSIVSAIEYAESKGANICNLSIECYTDDPKLRAAIRNSRMLFCVSAGNGGFDLDKKEIPVYPACYDFENLITVANIRCDGTLNEQSNYGKRTVDIAAPGTDIIAAYPGGGYEYCSGTSVATPLITGVAALIFGYSQENLDSRELKSKVLQAVKHNKKLEGKISSSSIISMERAYKRIITR